MLKQVVFQIVFLAWCIENETLCTSRSENNGIKVTIRRVQAIYEIFQNFKLDLDKVKLGLNQYY